MPYGKRYTRKTRKTNRYRKTRRTFTRFNTYRNRSSKAQAYQIYKLNKKINHVYKLSKPELQVYQSDAATIDTAITTDTVRGRYFSVHRCIDQGLNLFNGKYARIKNAVFTGSLSWGGNPGELTQQCVGCLRLIFFRPKTQQWDVPAPGDILPVSMINCPNEYFMKCPLRQGFSTKYKLVGDYKFYLYPQKSNIRFINIRIKYPYSLRREHDMNNDDYENNEFPTNSLMCCSYICRAGDYTSVLDTFNTELFMKLVYTDDNYSTAGNNRQLKTDSKTDINDVKIDDSNN